MEKLKKLTSDDFRNYLNQEFKLEMQEDRPLALRLVQVEDLILRREGEIPQDSGRTQFSLIFQGPPEPLLPQSIYPLEHAGMGQLGLFLVPLGPQDGGVRYEAVFT